MRLSNKTLLMIGMLILTGCGKAASTDTAASADNSVSGLVGGSVGGALSSSGSNGNYALNMSIKRAPTFMEELRNALNPMPKALAAGFCPTFKSQNAQCTTNASEMWLAYNDCTFAGYADWSGVQEITMSAGNAACGTFPNPGANATLYRQIVQAAGGSVPGSLTISDGILTGTIDDATAKLGNFDNQNIGTIINNGYGQAVTFDNTGARNGLTIGHHITVSGVYDHSLTGSLTIQETLNATSRTVSGTVTTYHNLLRVVAVSTFQAVEHDDTCCLPLSGTISTTFSAGQNVQPRALGESLVGKSESLTFNGCGTAVYTGPDGSTKNVTLNHCF